MRSELSSGPLYKKQEKNAVNSDIIKFNCNRNLDKLKQKLTDGTSVLPTNLVTHMFDDE
jgi:hypothetical protein